MTDPKPRRAQLAKAELLLHLAVTVEGWATALREAGTGEGAKRLPSIEEWESDGTVDPLAALLRTYDLSPADLARICGTLGAELEARALRAGYADHYDPKEAR